MSGRRTTSGGSDDGRGRSVTETAKSGRLDVDVGTGAKRLRGRKGSVVYARIEEVDRDEMDEEEKVTQMEVEVMKALNREVVQAKVEVKN